MNQAMENDSEKSWHEKKMQLADKFSSEWGYSLLYSPLKYSVWMALLHGATPYNTIEQLIKIIEEQQKNFEKLLNKQ
jgi:hypothetical protein